MKRKDIDQEIIFAKQALKKRNGSDCLIGAEFPFRVMKNI